MARDFHCGFEIAVYARTVYVRRVVEREGVIKCLTVRYLMSPGAEWRGRSIVSCFFVDCGVASRTGAPDAA